MLKKINRSEWAAPTFIIPKKDGTVRFISDFRELNKRIKRKTILNSKNTGNAIKTRSYPIWNFFRSKHVILSYRVNTKLKEAMYYCTALGKI